MHNLCLGHILRRFQARRKIWFAILKAKPQEEKHGSSCQQL